MSDRFFTVFIGIFMIFAIPYVTTCIVQEKNSELRRDLKSINSGRHVCISENGEYELIDVEEYILYSLAGKVDMNWNDEMLKCMAVIFRTSIYYQMENQEIVKADKNIINEEDLYEIRYSNKEIENIWGSRYNQNMERLCNAVLSTSGETIKCQDKLIMPVYHRISVGHTVSALELYGVDIPYLQNVDSSVDIEAENFSVAAIYSENRLKKEFSQMDMADIYQKELSNNEEKVNGEKEQDTEYSAEEFKIVEATESGFAKWINVFGNLVDSRTFAEVLQLPSTNVHIDIVDNGYRIISIGEGNSLGLSLYGAAAFAENGMKYRDIIEYYYSDVEITAGK
ncbi:MAG: SpoIID/LytB domain-containing protein [Coprococcus sp.]